MPKSRRIAGKATLVRALPALLEHIGMLETHEELAILKAQMEDERIPQTRVIKEAFEQQEQVINQAEEEQAQAEAKEESKVKEKVRRALTSRIKRKLPSGRLFGYAPSKDELRRAKMRAAVEGPAALAAFEAAQRAKEDRDFERAIAALPEEQEARAANDAAAAEEAHRRELAAAAMNELAFNLGGISLGKRQGGRRKRRTVRKKRGSRRSRR